MKIYEVIDKIRAYHPPMDENHTCDVFKCGDPKQECTGIVTTCYASMNVVREAVRLKANLIIVHEPTFYSNADETDWLEGVMSYEEKRRLLDENGIVVWRDHDHIHAGPQSEGRTDTDMVFYAIMKELGWEEYLIGDIKKPLLYQIPETTVRQLTGELCEKLNLNGARIIGDPDGKVSKVFIAEHIGGHGPMNKDQQKILRVEREDFDVLIPLETVDWTILEYITDSTQAGRSRAVISMGHFNFEEPAMKFMAENWLPEILDHTVPVRFVQCGDIYSYITR